MSYVFLLAFFFTAAHLFSSRWSLAFFHRPRCKISMLFFQRNSYPFFIISRSSSFSVIHISVDIKLKFSLGFVAIFSQNTKVFEMQNYIPAYVKGWTHCTDIRKGNFLDA